MWRVYRYERFGRNIKASARYTIRVGDPIAYTKDKKKLRLN
jgi:hypothetical protein